MQHIASCGTCPSSAELRVKVSKSLHLRFGAMQEAKGDGGCDIQAGQELQSVCVAPLAMAVPEHEGSMERTDASQPSPKIGLLDVAKAELHHSGAASSGDVSSSGEGELDEEDFDLSVFRDGGNTSFSSPSMGNQV